MNVNEVSARDARTVSVGVHEDALPSVTRERYPAARVGREFIPPLPRGKEPGKMFERIRELARPWRDGGVRISCKPAPGEVAAGDRTVLRNGPRSPALRNGVIAVHRRC
jgi:hypothetical protein